MRGISVAAASAAVAVLSSVSGAVAADLDSATKAPAYKAVPITGPQTCTNIVDFFTTACQLSAYGIRFYGTIDVGYGYQTNGSKFNKDYSWGVNYFLSKANSGGKWLLSPNAMSASNVGFQIKEAIGGGWSFVGQVQANFDPYSFHLLDAPKSLADNAGLPLAQQTASGDASNNGQFYNGLGFAGFSNDTWGTITFGRQNSLGGDAVQAYDPMHGAAGFSVIGYSGAMAGGGDTENKLGNTSVKYRVNYGNYRLGLYGQFGGYDEGNAAKGQFQADIGGDFHVGPGVLSLDVEGGYTKDGVGIILNSSNAIKATISDNTNVLALAKYTFDKLQLFAGYEWIQFAPPSDTNITSFTDISGDVIGVGGIAGSTVSVTDFNQKDKIQQMFWAGARYSLTDSLDVSAAYYGYQQNTFLTGCANAAKTASSCSGAMNAASVLLDWKFAPKWDTYIGTFYSSSTGGLNAGYASKDNLATTAGLRFRW